MNVAAHVSRVASEYPGRVALTTSDESWTYAELLDAAAIQEAALDASGLTVGDRVVLMLPNSVTFVVVYLACLRRGYVPVPISPSLTDDEIHHVLADSGAAAAAVSEELADKVTGCTPQPPHVIKLARTVPRPGEPMAAHRRASDPVSLDGAHPATLLYTSGTSGRPKGVLLTHSNVIFTMRAKADYLSLRPDDVLLLFLPLHHCYGLKSVLNPGLQAGATVVLAERFEREKMLKLASDHGVTRLFGVPQVFQLLLDTGITQESIPTVKYALSAGDVLPDDVQRRWHEQVGWPIHQEYGLTEAPFSTYSHVSGARPGSVGPAVDGVEISIRREEGEKASCGEIGEIWLHGPNVMRGYWNSIETTAVVDDWLSTGDNGKVDEDGYLYLAGRSSEVIIVAGNNVYASEVERALLDDVDVVDAAVYGVSHDLVGEMVCASVIPRNGELTASQIRAACADRLAAYKVPVAIDLVESLPTGKTGKKNRRALAASARARWSQHARRDGRP